jgi:MFS family permease
MLNFARDNARFLQDNARWLAGGFLLTMFSSFGQTFFIGLSGTGIRETFHLSGGGFGAIYMLATLASAMTLPWLGRTLDLMPGWKVARFTIPALAAACLLIAVAPDIAVLTLSFYFLRLFGQGMMTEIAFTEIGRWFVANRGRAMALIAPGQQAGSAILPAIVVLIERASGDWRTAWYASAVVLIVMALPLVLGLLSVERLPRSHEAKARDLKTARDWTRAVVVRDPVLYLLLAGTLVPAFVGTAIFFHQGYLIELRHYDPLAFAVSFTVMSVATILFGLVCGYLIDRFGSLSLMPYFLLPMAVASALLGIVPREWGLYAFMLLMGISNGFTSTLLGALWPEVYGLANLGGIRAITVSAMVLSSALGPGITGALMDLGVPLPSQMIWMAGWCLLASFALAAAAKKVQRRELMAAA